MATQWVLSKISDALAPTVSNACSTAGSAAGGALNYVGTSINSVGDGLGSRIRSDGDGARDYGNSVMDWSRAGGTRAQTASNPLGLSGSTAGGKAGVSSPSVYRAPAKDNKKEVVKKKVAEKPKGVGSGSATRTNVKPKVEQVKKVSAVKAGGVKADVGQKKVTAVKPRQTVNKPNSSVVKAKTPVKTGSPTIVKAKSSVSKVPTANPLGLK